MHKRTGWFIAGGTMVVLGAIGAIFLGQSLLGPRAPEEAMDPPHFVEQAAAGPGDGVHCRHVGRLERRFSGKGVLRFVGATVGNNNGVFHCNF